MSKYQWTKLTLFGIFSVVMLNVWMIERDAKHIQTQPQSEKVIYKQLPVIPFSE